MAWSDAPPTQAELSKTTPASGWDSAPPTKEELAQSNKSAVMANINKMNESGDASNDALFDTLALQYLPQIKAKAGQILNGEGIANDDNYLKRRDKAIADSKALAEKYPGAHREGTAVGFIAPMLMTGGASALPEAAAEGVPLLAGKVAAQAAKTGVGKVIARGAGTGALFGAAVNPGDTEGVVDPYQIGARAVNSALGAGLGGTVAAGAEALPGVAEKVAKFADQKAFKGIGAMLKDFRKAYANDSIEDTGRFVLDNKLMKAGDTFGDVAERASTLRDSVGKEIGTGYDAAAQILPKLGPEAAAKVEAAGFNPVRDKDAILQAAKDELGYAYNGKKALAGLSDYIDELAEKHGDQTLNPQLTNEIKTALDKTAIGWERNPLTREPDAESALKTMRGFLNDKVKDQIQTMGDAIGNPDAAKNLTELNAKYGMASKVARIAGDRANREGANKAIGLTDTISGGAGATIGAKIGMSAGGPAGAVVGGIVGGGAGALANKGARTYGNQIAAVSADSLANLIKNSPSLVKLQQTNPAAYEAIVAKLKTPVSSTAAPTMSDLNKGSSTSAQYKASSDAPAKGRDKWASDGFDKVSQHAPDEQLDKAVLMGDPRSKELLIQASDLKPGTPAMEKMLAKIKNHGKGNK